jgi:hypothetical protein
VINADSASAATEGLPEVAAANTAATTADAVAELALNGDDASAPEAAAPAATDGLTDSHDTEIEPDLDASEAFVAYEHDPHAATITHVDIESDPNDVTVEVEALSFVEEQLEAEARAKDQSLKDQSIETGEFEMAELGLATKPATVIEAEFEVDDISSAQSDDDEADAADDEEELSASPQSSPELVAAPRDRDD